MEEIHFLLMETKKKKTHFTKFLICNEIGISIRVVAKFHFYYYANASELTLSYGGRYHIETSPLICEQINELVSI